MPKQIRGRKRTATEQKEHKERMRLMHNAEAKRRRDRLKAMSAEEKVELAAQKKSDKYWREENKREKAAEKLLKQNIKREVKVLKYMLKSGVLFHHHGRTDCMKKTIQKQLEVIKERGEWKVYESYLWNYLGQGNNYNSRCLLGCLFGGRGFETIYDVPLDGSYIFYITDSGQRGLGTYNYMSVKKVEETTVVPKVNPGAFRLTN